jgi:hypothetical protein
MCVCVCVCIHVFTCACTCARMRVCVVPDINNAIQKYIKNMCCLHVIVKPAQSCSISCPFREGTSNIMNDTEG